MCNKCGKCCADLMKKAEWKIGWISPDPMNKHKRIM